MRAKIALAIAALCLASCGSDASGSFDGDDGESGSYRIDEDSGETVAEIKTRDGKATIRSGEGVPVKLPNGFSLYPGAKVMNNTTFAMDDSSGALIIFESEAQPQAIADFYRKQADAAGIELELEMSINDGEILGGKSAGGRTFSLNVAYDGDVTTGQLMVGEKMGE